MTLVASGQLNLATIAAEYGAPTVDLNFGELRRGHPSRYVRSNSANNLAVNMSAGVPATATDLKITEFYGQGRGWRYTNSTTRTNHYHCHAEFGDDWLGTNGTYWPCEYINNATMGATSTSYYALVIYGRQNNGPFTFTNNSEIQGAGGAANSGAGQHAVYIYNSENASQPNRPIIVNNGAIRGGGGGGGKGGTGGTGGQGYYDTPYTAQEGPVYDPSSYYWYTTTGAGNDVVRWANSTVYSAVNIAASVVVGGITYFRHTLRSTTTSGGGYQPHTNPEPTYYHRKYEIYRQYPASSRTITNGGVGGAGGNGGQGIGYNDPNTAGVAGANGAGGGTNAGAGGKGGTGGTGGGWGAAGGTGATGATGPTGNYSGGAGGAAGSGGGAAGYSIYAASKWGYANYGTNNGLYGGGVANT